MPTEGTRLTEDQRRIRRRAEGLRDVLDEFMGDTDLMGSEDVSPEFKAFRALDALIEAWGGPYHG